MKNLFSLEITDTCQKDFDRLLKKNKTLEVAVEKAIKKILISPEHFKPLRWPMENTRRVHVLGSLVLVYEIRGEIITLLSFDHHDNVYKN